MSSLARYFNTQGYTVAGYDRTRSALSSQLESEGIVVTYEDDINSVSTEFKTSNKAVMVVYTPAIPRENTLFDFFKNNEFTISKRAEILGVITRQTINLSVAGTHGKTTTSSMVATILQQSDLKFSAFLGGISTNLGSNYYYQEGESEHYSVAEADEFDRSFLNLNPQYTVITSTDADHLDVYGKKSELLRSYVEFSELVVNKENRFYALHHADELDGVSYAIEDSKADYYAKVHAISGRGTSFDIVTKDGNVYFEDLYINIPGKHNLENAIGATLMSAKAGVNVEAIKSGLANFKGIKRRFEYVIDNESLICIDDYAHHPSELKAIISSVKDLYPGKHITAVFQPHLFSRTMDFMSEFATELSLVDRLFILPIYPARELPMEGVTSEKLLKKIKLPSAQVVQKENLIEELNKNKIEILLTLGAGDIDRLVEPIAKSCGDK